MATGPITKLDDLVDLVESRPGLMVRFSEGPEKDAEGGSIDYESGLEMPGLSANRLDAEAWWTRPLRDWVSRQVCQYAHMAERSPEHRAWVIRGELVGRGPDDEPLVRDPEYVAWLADELLDEAAQCYHTRFDAGRASR